MAYTSDIPSDILDDLSSRFIINAPSEQQEVPVRLCFLIEGAWWFYTDFYCAENRQLKSCGMKEFTAQIMNHIPYLNHFLEDLDEIFEEWRYYKSSVPTFGAILLNDDLTKVLLVQSYFAKASWGFPKGKVNQEEEPRHCAIREVKEETGFDIINLIDDDEFIETTINDQTVRLYIVPGVSEDTKFQPKTRNEIKSVEWFVVNDLPVTKKDITAKIKNAPGRNSFYMVFPFLRKIKRWIYEKTQKPHLSNQRRRYKSCGEQNNMSNIQNIAKTKPLQYFQNFKLMGYDNDNSQATSSADVQNIQQSSFKRQLFKDDETSNKKYPNQNTTCTSCRSLSKNGPYFCVTSWLNFKLDKAAILKCFDG